MRGNWEGFVLEGGAYVEVKVLGFPAAGGRIWVLTEKEGQEVRTGSSKALSFLIIEASDRLLELPLQRGQTPLT